MRKMTAMIVMVCVVLTAGFAVAAVNQNTNVDIGNTNNINVGGGAANSDQSQDQGQAQDQRQHQEQIANGGAGGNANATGGKGGEGGNAKSEASLKDSANSSVKNTYVSRGNLPSVGFNGFLAPGKADQGQWQILCSEMYMDWAVDDVEEASYKKGFFSYGFD